MTTKKLLCPTDFSSGSSQALRTAARLASERDLELVIAHVWHVPPSAYSELTYPEDLMTGMREDAERGLDQVVTEAKQHGATRVSGKLLTGVPWLAACDELADPAYELVVVGTHGRTGVSRILLGSVAAMIVRHAPCSVLVVRPDADPSPYEHLLCAVDFSASSHDAMLAAPTFARSGGSRVTLLHTLEVPIDFSMDVELRTQELLRTWAKELSAASAARVTSLSRRGRPGAQILEHLDSEPSIDLVVLGSHGRTGIKRVLMGSVAEQIVRHARCPVLVVRVRG